MAKSGSFNTTSYQGRYLTFSWAVESQSVENNSTTISWTLKGAGTGQSSWYMAAPFKVIIDGATVFSSSTRIKLYNGTVVSSGNYTIKHTANGTKTFTASAEGAIYLSTVNCKGSANFTLPKIDRYASIISATNFKDTENPAIEFSNPGKNKLKFTIGAGVTDDLIVRDNLVGVSSPYSFELTETERNSLRSLTPNSNSLQVTFTVYTYSSGTAGNPSSVVKTMTITAANPTITGATYKDTNNTTTAITGNNQNIIQNNSILQVTASGLAALKYATLKTVAVTVNGVTKSKAISGSSASSVTVDFGAVNVASNTAATVTVTDSRGNATSKDIALTVEPWQKPTAIITCHRVNNFYSETELTVNADFSSLGGKNAVTIKYQYQQKGGTSWTTAATVQDGATTTINLDNTKEWSVKVVVSDRLGSTTHTFNINKGIPIAFIDRLKSSVGVNCFPSREKSFEVDGKTIDDFISDRVQAGNTTITSVTANTLKEVDVVFPRKFESKPRVVVTPNTKTPVGIDCGVTNITTTGFKLWYNSTANRSTTYVLWVAYLDDGGEAQADAETISYPDGTPPRPITENEYAALLAKPDANTTYSLSKNGSTITLAGSDGSTSSVEDSSGGSGGGSIDKSEIVNLIYPVGAIYMSVNAASPATLFGGTWERIQDTFLLAAGSTYAAGTTGGEAEHTLTKEEMPNHRHTSDSFMYGYPNYTTDVNTYCTWVNNGIQNSNDPATGENGAVRTSYVGGNKAHNNMPPYMAVYVWKRTA